MSVNPTEVAQRIGDRLEEAGLEYAIGGALALGVWGVPRTTRDVDLSIFSNDFSRIADALERAGMIFDRAHAPKDIDRIGMFTGRMSGVVVDMFVSNHPQMMAMQARRRRVDGPDGSHLYFISAEDLAVMKLVYGRPKDVGDLAALFAKRTLDVDYIRAALARMPNAAARMPVLDDLVKRF